jgi:tetratricopeptide (TPR) repeat protein
MIEPSPATASRESPPIAEYLLTAKTPEGKKVTERLDVSSADEAVRTLRERGYEDIVLHTDDSAARYTRHSVVQKHISPGEYVALRGMHAGLSGHLRWIVFITFKVYKTNWKSTLALLALLVFALMKWHYDPRPVWGRIALLPAMGLASPFILLPIIAIFNPGRRYRRVIEELSWGRWENVLALLPAIRARLPEEHAAYLEAKALAGLGNLDEALALYRPLGDGSRIPDWQFWSHVSNIYWAAGQIESMVAAQEKAGQLAAENPTVLLDLAMALLRYKKDDQRAANLIQQAKSHAISDVMAPSVLLAKGCSLLSEEMLLERSKRFNRPWLANRA